MRATNDHQDIAKAWLQAHHPTRMRPSPFLTAGSKNRLPVVLFRSRGLFPLDVAVLGRMALAASSSSEPLAGVTAAALAGLMLVALRVVPCGVGDDA
jgi:hypothetical protein